MSESELLGYGLPGEKHISPFILPAVWCSVFDGGLACIAGGMASRVYVVLCVTITSEELSIIVWSFISMLVFIRLSMYQELVQKDFFYKKRIPLKNSVETGNYKLAAPVDLTGFVKLLCSFKDLHFLYSLRQGKGCESGYYGEHWPLW